MRIHLQGTGRCTTANSRQIERLFEPCFEDGQWKAGLYHGPPSSKDVGDGVDNVCAVIATLGNNLATVSLERAINMPA